MKPARLDLPIVWRGCEYSTITLRWLNASGAPIDLTGWTARARSKQIDFHPVFTDPANGYTQISLTNLETADLNLGVEAWDWIFLNAFAQVVFPFPLLAGYVEIKEPVAPTDIP